MLAMVGGGYWGKNLVRCFHKLGVLSAICDANPVTLASYRNSYPDVKTVPDYASVISDESIKAVCLAVPAELHFLLAKEALLAGKDVYVEKPLALVEAEAAELCRLAADRNRILMVGHILQYHPAFLKLRSMIEQGEMGRVHYMYSNRLNLGKIRREENILWSFAPHDISMILSLAGEPVESVFATSGYYLHKSIADVTTTHVNFASGLKAHIYVSWLHPFKEQKLVVVGDRLMAVFDDTKPWNEKLVTYRYDIGWKEGMPVTSKADPIPVLLEEAEPLLRECSQFIESVNTRKAPPTDGAEGLRVLKILGAAQRSMETGVTISLAKAPAPSVTVHETACVDVGVTLGEGVKVWHFSHVLKGSVLGRNCNVGQNVVIGPDVAIGENCKIQNNVSVYKGVTLEDNVFCGPSMVFTNVFNPRSEIRRMDELRKTLVKQGATLGANCTIVCGITIGEYAFIGAGAVVTKDVPAYALMRGNPARVAGWACRCGEKLSFKNEGAHCGSCKRNYVMRDGIAHPANS